MASAQGCPHRQRLQVAAKAKWSAACPQAGRAASADRPVRPAHAPGAWPRRDRRRRAAPQMQAADHLPWRWSCPESLAGTGSVRLGAHPQAASRARRRLAGARVPRSRDGSTAGRKRSVAPTGPSRPDVGEWARLVIGMTRRASRPSRPCREDASAGSRRGRSWPRPSTRSAAEGHARPRKVRPREADGKLPAQRTENHRPAWAEHSAGDGWVGATSCPSLPAHGKRTGGISFSHGARRPSPAALAMPFPSEYPCPLARAAVPRATLRGNTALPDRHALGRAG